MEYTSTQKFKIEEITLSHIKKLTNDRGIEKSCNENEVDLNSEYCIDDNAHALIALINHYELTKDRSDLLLIDIYLNFIKLYPIKNNTVNNNSENFKNSHSDSLNINNENNQISLGRSIWAIGEFISRANLFDSHQLNKAEEIFKNNLFHIENLNSIYAIAYTIKGLYRYNLSNKKTAIKEKIKLLANNLISKYYTAETNEIKWFKNELSFKDSVLSESLLYAYLETANEHYKIIAENSFEYLLSESFNDLKMNTSPEKYYYINEYNQILFHNYSTDVSNTILALDLFYEVFNKKEYWDKLEIGFSWFNGNNKLNKLMYNKNSGGCCNELKNDSEKINENAGPTTAYLIARLAIEKHFGKDKEENMMNKSFAPAISIY